MCAYESCPICPRCGGLLRFNHILEEWECRACQREAYD